jgi:hypothetical protein
MKLRQESIKAFFEEYVITFGSNIQYSPFRDPKNIDPVHAVKEKELIVKKGRTNLEAGDKLIMEVIDKTEVLRVDITIKVTYLIEEYDGFSFKAIKQDEQWN